MDTASLITQNTSWQAQNAYASGMSARAQQAAGSGAVKNTEQVKEAAQKFEAFFIGQMMEYMMAGLKSDETFGGGHAEETWRSMLNQEYGKEIAKTGRLGVTDSVMKAMIKAQEERDTAQQRLAQMQTDGVAGIAVTPQNAAGTATIAAKAAKIDVTT